MTRLLILVVGLLVLPLVVAQTVLAELVRIVDCLQALTLRLDVFAEEQARVIAELTAYIRDHSEADE